jgi:hypothetical protein
MNCAEQLILGQQVENRKEPQTFGFSFGLSLNKRGRVGGVSEGE